MQVDPNKPTLKAPGIKLLKLKYDETPSKSAFKFNLRRYTEDLNLLKHDVSLAKTQPAPHLSHLPGYLRGSRKTGEPAAAGGGDAGGSEGGGAGGGKGKKKRDAPDATFADVGEDEAGACICSQFSIT
jgi:hypothetical protein